MISKNQTRKIRVSLTIDGRKPESRTSKPEFDDGEGLEDEQGYPPSKNGDDLIIPRQKFDTIDIGENSSEESEEAVGSYVYQRSFEMEPDFFEVLGEIPSMSAITDDVETEEELGESEAAEVESEELEEVTKLAEPDQELIDTKEDEEDLSKLHVVGDEAKVEETEEESSELELPETEEEVVEEKPSDEGIFDTFFEVQTKKKVVIGEEVDPREIERIIAARQLVKSTREFLDDIIMQAVNRSEYVDPKIILSANLDKAKLLYQLRDLIGELKAEHRGRVFLNRKTVEYFRRKKSFRQITDDNIDTVELEKKKFMNAITELDEVLGRRQELKIKSSVEIERAESELAAMRERYAMDMENFEGVVRKAFKRDTFDRIGIVVEQQLRKMRELRKDLSSSRIVLIQRQHTHATLQAKLAQLENLGNGLLMRDFEQLQTETLSLDKKIEERNNELSKVRMRFNADLHILAHMKEKLLMLRNTIGVQKMALDDLQEERQICREYLFNLKLERAKLRKICQDLSFQSGLLDKPSLMLDYDQTVKRRELKKEQIENMREEYEMILKKIEKVERKCHP